jgi:ribosomal protein S18 acetylase RimI-like enzyme
MLAYEQGEIHIRNIKSSLKGAGTAVINFIVEFAEENGISIVVKKALDTAVSYWERLGFERIGLSEDYMLVR